MPDSRRTLLAGPIGTAVVLITMLGVLAVAFAVEDLHRMPRPSTSRRILTEFGYTEVRITGVHPLACSSGDTFRTGFEARSMAGIRVSGTVCQGWFKGATVRLR